MSKYSNSNYDGEFSFTFPNISHFKGLLEHLKFTNEKHGNFIFSKNAIEYQSKGFNDKLLNMVTLDISTFRYRYNSDDELYLGLDVSDLKNQLANYDKSCQIKISKHDKDNYVSMKPLSTNMQSIGYNNKLKIMNIDYEFEELPEYDKSPTCTMVTGALAKSIANLCGGSKNPTITLYCGTDGIMIESKHKADTAINEFTIGNVDPNDADRYSISHSMLKAITKIGSINKDKHTRIYYNPEVPLRFVVPISDNNGTLEVYMELKRVEEESLEQ